MRLNEAVGDATDLADEPVGAGEIGVVDAGRVQPILDVANALGDGAVWRGADGLRRVRVDGGAVYSAVEGPNLCQGVGGDVHVGRVEDRIWELFTQEQWVIHDTKG